MAEEHFPATGLGEASRLLDQLATETTGRAAIARRLAGLGVATRGSVRTRGSLRAPAESRLPESEGFDGLIRLLGDPDADARCQAACALGEWAGNEAAARLNERIRGEDELVVRLYCITALRTIGGPNAVAGLAWIAGRGNEVEIDAALSALEELAIGGIGEPTDARPASTRLQTLGGGGTGWVVGDPTAAVGPGGARGAPGDRNEGVLDLLRRVAEQEGRSFHVRHRASEVLRQFTD